jgi:hypothetical protein
MQSNPIFLLFYWPRGEIGIREGLKILCPKGRVSSTLTEATIFVE